MEISRLPMVTRLSGVLALLVALCAMALGMATPTSAAIPAEAKYCAGMIAPLTAEDKANGRLSQVKHQGVLCDSGGEGGSPHGVVWSAAIGGHIPADSLLERCRPGWRDSTGAFQ